DVLTITIETIAGGFDNQPVDSATFDIVVGELGILSLIDVAAIGALVAGSSVILDAVLVPLAGGAVIGSLLNKIIFDPIFFFVLDQFDAFEPDPDKFGIPTRPFGGAEGEAETSIDPNSKTAVSGFGPENFVTADAALSYRIDFENDPTATAP